MCNPKFRGTFTIFHEHAQSGKSSESPNTDVPADIERGDALPSPFSSLCKQVSFSLSIQCHGFGVFVLSVGDLLFQRVPKPSAEVLSGVPKHEKAAP